MVKSAVSGVLAETSATSAVAKQYRFWKEPKPLHDYRYQRSDCLVPFEHSYAIARKINGCVVRSIVEQIAHSVWKVNMRIRLVVIDENKHRLVRALTQANFYSNRRVWNKGSHTTLLQKRSCDSR